MPSDACWLIRGPVCAPLQCGAAGHEDCLSTDGEGSREIELEKGSRDREGSSDPSLKCANAIMAIEPRLSEPPPAWRRVMQCGVTIRSESPRLTLGGASDGSHRVILVHFSGKSEVSALEALYFLADATLQNQAKDPARSTALAPCCSSFHNRPWLALTSVLGRLLFVRLVLVHLPSDSQARNLALFLLRDPSQLDV